MSQDDGGRRGQPGPVRARGALAGSRRTDRPQPKERLTADRIVDAALELMKVEGYDAVSMRSLARALDTGPASLYAHVRNKDELDQLVIDRITSMVELPEPDPERWQEQLKDLFRRMLELFREHPGAARATLGMIPAMEGPMRAADRMMAIAVAGGVSPQAAAWFCDLSSLYVGALAYEESIWVSRENTSAAGETPDPDLLDDQLREFMEALGDRFPFVRRFAAELSAGSGDERFEFGMDVLVSGLAAVSERYR